MNSADLNYPGGRYQLLPYRTGEPAPALPDGYGGLAIRTWRTSRLAADLAPIVGVDGEPAMYGWGEALVPLPPGEHLVEVQYVEPVHTALVTVAAGAVSTVDYPPGTGGSGRPTRGSNRPAYASKPFNPAVYSLLVGVFAFLAGAALMSRLEVPVGVGGAVLAVFALLVVAVGPIVMYRRHRRHTRGRTGRRGTS